MSGQPSVRWRWKEEASERFGWIHGYSSDTEPRRPSDIWPRTITNAVPAAGGDSADRRPSLRVLKSGPAETLNPNAIHIRFLPSLQTELLSRQRDEPQRLLSNLATQYLRRVLEGQPETVAVDGWSHRNGFFLSEQDDRWRKLSELPSGDSPLHNKSTTIKHLTHIMTEYINKYSYIHYLQ